MTENWIVVIGLEWEGKSFILGRLNKLQVKTESKYVLKNFALSSSHSALLVLEKIQGGRRLHFDILLR